MISHIVPHHAAAIQAGARLRDDGWGALGRVKGMALFVSKFVNKLDRKGRVSLPADFRAVLTELGFQKVALFPSFNSVAIEGCGPDRLEALADSADAAYDFFSPEQNHLGTELFGRVSSLTWDPEGRILLSEEMRDHAGITDSAAFVGKGRTFQIWEPEALNRQQAEARAKLMQNPPKISLRRPEGA